MAGQENMQRCGNVEECPVRASRSFACPLPGSVNQDVPTVASSGQTCLQPLQLQTPVWPSSLPGGYLYLFQIPQLLRLLPLPPAPSPQTPSHLYSSPVPSFLFSCPHLALSIHRPCSAGGHGLGALLSSRGVLPVRGEGRKQYAQTHARKLTDSH